MEKIIYVTIFVVILASIYLKSRQSKINKELVLFKKELIAGKNILVFCLEVKKIPIKQLKALSEKEKERISSYLKYMVRDRLNIGHDLSGLLEAISCYKIRDCKKKFIADCLFHGIGIKDSASILAEIIYSEAMGASGGEREKNFILSCCGQILDFQKNVVRRLEEYKTNPLTNGYEILAIEKKLRDLNWS